MWKTRAGEGDGEGEGEDGQATVELVAILPVLGLVLALAWQSLLAGQTWWLAGAAAREAARASALGADPAAAAHRIAPDAGVVPQRDGSIRLRLAIPSAVPGLDLGRVTTHARMEPQS
jgi:hypothetical protein